MTYGANFIQTIVNASAASTWEAAVCEWEIIGCIEDPTHSESCVCGHENLRYIFTIENLLNGNVITNIGSSCIKKFERDELNNDATCWKMVFKLISVASKAGNLLKVPFEAPYYSRKLLWFFYEHDVFKATRCNGYDEFADYEFMIDMFNARNRTTAQNRKVNAILEYNVRPFLIGVWRESKGQTKQRER